MKKLTIILLGFVFVLASCSKKKKDDDGGSALNPTQTQWALAINYTGTW